MTDRSTCKLCGGNMAPRADLRAKHADPESCLLALHLQITEAQDELRELRAALHRLQEECA